MIISDLEMDINIFTVILRSELYLNSSNKVLGCQKLRPKVVSFIATEICAVYLNVLL